jgi:hypothetical protein
MMTDDPDLERNEAILDLMARYSAVVDAGIQERWNKIDLDLYDSETFEAIGALLARQGTLTIQLANAPSIWNGHVAPLILRAMVDAHITLAWVLRDKKARARQYILYGLGQEKLFIEHLKNSQPPVGLLEDYEKMIEARENWLNSQRRDFLTEVNVGSWSGLNTRDMAQEADCLSLYNFAYLPFSGVVHSMWQHTSIYNLRNCQNPLHKFHRIPDLFLQAPLDPDYVYRSAKYVSRSCEVVDEYLGLKIETPMPQRWFAEAMSALADKFEGQPQAGPTTS